MPLKNSNVARGLPANATYQVGASDVDAQAIGQVEKGFKLPWPSDPEDSWVYYQCEIDTFLDSGIVVHNVLPQVDNQADTLATCDYADPKLASIVGPGGNAGHGVNIISRDRFTDIKQRMAHSRYWFRLYGQAMRVGYQVPIPGLKMVGGVEAIPYDKNPQFAYNRIAGNYGGVILWHAAWSMWYTTLSPPNTRAAYSGFSGLPAANPMSLVNATDAAAPLPDGIQSPYDQPDDNAVPAAPPFNAQPVPRGNNAQF